MTQRSPIQKITTFLWFDTQAEEAANFYCSIFKNSKVGKIVRYGGSYGRFAANLGADGKITLQVWHWQTRASPALA